MLPSLSFEWHNTRLSEGSDEVSISENFISLLILKEWSMQGQYTYIFATNRTTPSHTLLNVGIYIYMRIYIYM